MPLGFVVTCSLSLFVCCSVCAVCCLLFAVSLFDTRYSCFCVTCMFMYVVS